MQMKTVLKKFFSEQSMPLENSIKTGRIKMEEPCMITYEESNDTFHMHRGCFQLGRGITQTLMVLFGYKSELFVNGILQTKTGMI